MDALLHIGMGLALLGLAFWLSGEILKHSEPPETEVEIMPASWSFPEGISVSQRPYNRIEREGIPIEWSHFAGNTAVSS